VVYVSMDSSLAEMRANVAGKGWLCVPFDDKVKTHLVQRLSVSSIPSLVILDPNGERAYERVVSKAGRTAILRNGATCLDEWERGECLAEASGAEAATFGAIVMTVRCGGERLTRAIAVDANGTVCANVCCVLARL